MKVQNLTIREIFATNSQKTIEIELETLKGVVRSSVPMGTSTGKYETRSLSTEDVIHKFLIVRRYFTAHDFVDQKDVDYQLHAIDKSADFREIGGNLALAISSAFLKAFAQHEGQEVFEYLINNITKKEPKDDEGLLLLPKPLCNVVGGWAGTDSSDIQEFLLLPVHQISFKDSITKIAKSYQAISQALKEKDMHFVFAKNYESAWVTTLHFEEILKILTKVANENLQKIGLDIAASNLWDGKNYFYRNSMLRMSRIEQIAFISDLVKRYPIFYIEDPFFEDDVISFSTLTHQLTGRIVCGDDFYATNMERLKQGIASKATNAIIIKPNQVGTITDTIDVAREADRSSMITVMSHRSGETEDTIMCHLAVGLGCNYIKLGISGERTVKINEMLRIEDRLKGSKQ